MKIHFSIDHIDSLGQGVSKISDKVTFIPKTLLGESGVAEIYKESKGVRFAFIDSASSIENKSIDRIQSPCKHYDLCHSCHFLHTSYENEMTIKKFNLERQLEKLETIRDKNRQLQIHPSENRFGYRNRIQLHYDKSKNKIGFINPILNKIIEIPECLIGIGPINDVLNEFYSSGNWKKLARKKKGHLELHYHDGKTVKITSDEHYSFDGFDQVNKPMNDKLVDILTDKFNELSANNGKTTILDLFGGSGNLSKKMKSTHTFIIDSYKSKKINSDPSKSFIQFNLYGKNALKDLESLVKVNPELMIIDPPRSGLKNLSQFTDLLLPKNIFYISCNSATMIRDISMLDGYQIVETHLFDFFPNTRHFETFIHLTKITKNFDLPSQTK